MKICLIADPHASVTIHTAPADLLAVAGDLTMNGSLEQLDTFIDWVKWQPQKHKVVIAGNHDFCFENADKDEAKKRLSDAGIIYLFDNEILLEGKRIYGSPWQPWFYDWAFNLPRGAVIAEKWNLIPEDLDLLLVHGPPYGYGDETLSGERVGCKDLLREIKKKKPKLVSCGHIHEGYGMFSLGETKLVNCSVGYRVGKKDNKPRQPIYLEI